MGALIDKLIAEYWPLILSAGSGFVIALFLYLKARLNFKTQLTEKEVENVKLQTAIAKGSYIICPSCGSKVFLANSTIYTGGQKEDEKQTTN